MASEDRCSERERDKIMEGGVGTAERWGNQTVASKCVENTEEPIVSFFSLELQLTATTAEL